MVFLYSDTWSDMLLDAQMKQVIPEFICCIPYMRVSYDFKAHFYLRSLINSVSGSAGKLIGIKLSPVRIKILGPSSWAL